MKMRLCAPCLFGLEGPLSDELKALKMEEITAENGRVYFSGDEKDMAAANLWLRTAERVMIHAGSFPAKTFDDLFEGTKALPWEDWIPRDGAFPVRGHCVDSALMSVPDCCSIIKKAAADRLSGKFGIDGDRLPETGAKYQIRFTILKDSVAVYIDTSGPALHKRGYRALSNEAPLRETLAAALVMLSKYRGQNAFCDPFCGSGTIPIEAAMIAKNRAPGIRRRFDFENWTNMDTDTSALRKEAKAKEFDREYDISGSDIDPAAVELARSNAEKAGVSDLIKFSLGDARQFDTEAEKGRIVTNPPYGVRMSKPDEVIGLIRDFGVAVKEFPGWQVYVLSGDADFERSFGRKAVKKRKLYNGMLKCDFYMYYDR